MLGIYLQAELSTEWRVRWTEENNGIQSRAGEGVGAWKDKERGRGMTEFHVPSENGKKVHPTALEVMSWDKMQIANRVWNSFRVVYFVLFFILEPHPVCSEVIPGFEPRNYSWWGSGDHTAYWARVDCMQDKHPTSALILAVLRNTLKTNQTLSKRGKRLLVPLRKWKSHTIKEKYLWCSALFGSH